MNLWKPGTNLKEYVSHNPPGATFFLCLLTLAISFIILSSYSYTHSLPNPDVKNDWNSLLSSLAQFQLCEKPNASSTAHSSSNPPGQIEKNNKTTPVPSTEIPSEAFLHLQVPLTVRDIGQKEDIGLFTTLTSSQLKLGGTELVKFSLEILPENSEYSCLKINAPAHILPMKLLPPECKTQTTNLSLVPVEVSFLHQTESQNCYTLDFKQDPAFTVMLTREEQIIAGKHLIEVSICLLCICLMLCLAASLKSSTTNREYLKVHNFQNEPLLSS